MRRRGLLLAVLLGLAGCQRGARLDVELMVSRAFPDSHVLAMPTAVELIDTRGLLFRLPVHQPMSLDLVSVSAKPVRLRLRGELPAGRYLGLRLVFDDRVWFELPTGSRVPLTVDQTGAFAELDVELDAGDTHALAALLDLDASVIRLGPFTDVHRFLPRLKLLAADDAGDDHARTASAATEIATLGRFMVR